MLRDLEEDYNSQMLAQDEMQSVQAAKHKPVKRDFGLDLAQTFRYVADSIVMSTQ